MRSSGIQKYSQNAILSRYKDGVVTFKVVGDEEHLVIFRNTINGL